MNDLNETFWEAIEVAAEATEKLAEAIRGILENISVKIQEIVDCVQQAIEDDAHKEAAENRHDGAKPDARQREQKQPQLRLLYGQGVDYGGPGPCPGLIRPADDGPRRAETGI